MDILATRIVTPLEWDGKWLFGYNLAAMLKPTGSFVLLYHILSDSAHWDLMLDCDSALATWQISVDPVEITRTASTDRLPARRIADHRKAYLDYEGPVSRNRGEVRRIDRGRYRLIEDRLETWVVQLDGTKFTGIFALPVAMPEPS